MSNERPLSGKTIVVTRRKEQAKEFSLLLEKQGARILLFPAVEIVDPPSWSACDAALQRLTEYSGIIFTSRNAIQYFILRAQQLHCQDVLRTCRMYPVGEKTRQVIELNGYHAEELPEQYTAADLAAMLTRQPLTGKKFLFPKGNLARNEMVTLLTGSGAIVEDIVVYQTKEPDWNAGRKAMLHEILHDADMVTFFSPSAVTHFLHAFSLDDLGKKTIAVFGETTAEEAVKKGLTVGVQSSQSSVEFFAETIVKYYS